MKLAKSKDIEVLMQKQLGTIFPYVCKEPIPLYNTKRKLLFSLFYCVSNRSSAAINLGHKISNHIINKRREEEALMR